MKSLHMIAALAALLGSVCFAAADDLDEMTGEGVVGPVYWEPVITRFTIEPRGDSETVAPIDAEKLNKGQNFANLLSAWETMKPKVRLRRNADGKPFPYDPADDVISGWKLDSPEANQLPTFLTHVATGDRGIQAILANAPIRIFFDLDVNVPLGPEQKDRALQNFKVLQLTIESHGVTDNEDRDARLKRLQPLQDELDKLTAGKPTGESQKQIDQLKAKMAQPADLRAAAHDGSEEAVKDRENQLKELQRKLNELRSDKENRAREIADTKYQIDKLQASFPQVWYALGSDKELIGKDYVEVIPPLRAAGSVLVEDKGPVTWGLREYRVKVRIRGRFNLAEPDVTKTVEAAIRVAFVQTKEGVTLLSTTNTFPGDGASRLKK